MLKAKSHQSNVNVKLDRGKGRPGDKIRGRQNARAAGEVAPHYGTRRDLRSTFVRLWADSRRAQGKPLDSDPGSGLEDETTSGFSFHRERLPPRAAAPGDSGLLSSTFGPPFYPLSGVQLRPTALPERFG